MADLEPPAEPRLKQGGYGTVYNVPRRQCQKLCPDALPTYVGLCAFGKRVDEIGNQTCYPSLDTLAAESGVSRRAVTRHLPLLEAVGLIKKNQTGGSNHYTIFAIPEPVDSVALERARQANRFSRRSGNYHTGGDVSVHEGNESERSCVTDDPPDGVTDDPPDGVTDDLSDVSSVTPESSHPDRIHITSPINNQIQKAVLKNAFGEPEENRNYRDLTDDVTESRSEQEAKKALQVLSLFERMTGNRQGSGQIEKVIACLRAGWSSKELGALTVEVVNRATKAGTMLKTWSYVAAVAAKRKPAAQGQESPQSDNAATHLEKRWAADRDTRSPEVKRAEVEALRAKYRADRAAKDNSS